MPQSSKLWNISPTHFFMVLGLVHMISKTLSWIYDNSVMRVGLVVRECFLFRNLLL
jgi:hypothetical protein